MTMLSMTHDHAQLDRESVIVTFTCLYVCTSMYTQFNQSECFEFDHNINTCERISIMNGVNIMPASQFTGLLLLFLWAVRRLRVAPETC